MSKVHLEKLGSLEQLDMFQEAAQYESTSLEHRLDVFKRHHVEANTCFACLVGATK